MLHSMLHSPQYLLLSETMSNNLFNNQKQSLTKTIKNQEKLLEVQEPFQDS